MSVMPWSLLSKSSLGESVDTQTNYCKLGCQSPTKKPTQISTCCAFKVKKSNTFICIVLFLTRLQWFTDKNSGLKAK